MDLYITKKDIREGFPKKRKGFLPSAGGKIQKSLLHAARQRGERKFESNTREREQFFRKEENLSRPENNSQKRVAWLKKKEKGATRKSRLQKQKSSRRKSI